MNTCELTELTLKLQKINLKQQELNTEHQQVLDMIRDLNGPRTESSSNVTIQVCDEVRILHSGKNKERIRKVKYIGKLVTISVPSGEKIIRKVENLEKII